MHGPMAVAMSGRGTLPTTSPGPPNIRLNTGAARPVADTGRTGTVRTPPRFRRQAWSPAPDSPGGPQERITGPLAGPSAPPGQISLTTTPQGRHNTNYFSQPT